MSWEQQFNRARQAGYGSSITVWKNDVENIPSDFTNSLGLRLDGINVYEATRGGETITIREHLLTYTVEVSPVGQPTFLGQNSASSRNGNGNPSLRDVAIGGSLFLGGLYLLGKAISGPQSPKKTHRIFISHSWQYEDQYQELTQQLQQEAGFEWYDHSVRSDDPIDAQLPNHLRSKLQDQIRSTSVVLILAGMYVARSEWIAEEVEIASEMGKPIIGIKPRGNTRLPKAVSENAVEVVKFDVWELIDAIERHAS
ncbi:TIR domain-containing protein [Halorarum halophilum]|uniref:TIR domain-containing protein n=1 Tax=Halorarum halophilum TaxID=2743090 RepID=A0A7D5K2M0_9EURY|nr:TIR domain-containing protein [Halobaculum halophilum]QLG28921.1 TIR domain-containing protein [Halobaculum halophilum]